MRPPSGGFPRHSHDEYVRSGAPRLAELADEAGMSRGASDPDVHPRHRYPALRLAPVGPVGRGAATAAQG
ncbi:hypothetical protein GCM10010383_65060 [Streptomyces lomondensis]|uniref:Uncharacterized protein n=1 Tax=Streptomyces lomondensis TaxID=68229 RepID=A0ABQ2XN49_9ACTN|nr:hypothetical protein GCM10010383_65060 [Streptomyces lomondensis]